MDMWTAALNWAMGFDTILNKHTIAMLADTKSAVEKKSSPEAALPLRSPAVASPATPTTFSLPRNSLTIPLDDDVKQLSFALLMLDL